MRVLKDKRTIFDTEVARVAVRESGSDRVDVCVRPRVAMLAPARHEGKVLYPDGLVLPERSPKRLMRGLRHAIRREHGAVTVSGLFIKTWMDVLDTTQLAVDLDLETHKVAMFTNSITPNFSTDTAYAAAPYNANEVSGTGYSAGGTALIGTTVTESPSGTLMFDANDTSWAGSTITNARAALIYADALAGDNALVLVNFGSDFSTNNGTFTIQWAAGGIFTWDITP